MIELRTIKKTLGLSIYEVLLTPGYYKRIINDPIEEMDIKICVSESLVVSSLTQEGTIYSREHLQERWNHDHIVFEKITKEKFENLFIF